MRIFLVVFFLMANAFGAIKTEGESILPFQRKGYPLKELIKDYAEALKINVSYPEDLLSKDQSRVDLYIHEKTSFSHFSSLFKSLLDSRGYTLIQENGFQWIAHARDVRFLPSEFYANQKFPNDESYVTVLFRLKYPIAPDITRNLRPFLSRYGRVVNFPDGRSIVLHDKGDNVLKLIEAINFMDTEKVYKVALDKKPEESAPEDNPLNEKVVELELKNKILEKKLTEQESGGPHEATSGVVNRRN